MPAPTAVPSAEVEAEHSGWRVTGHRAPSPIPDSHIVFRAWQGSDLTVGPVRYPPVLALAVELLGAQWRYHRAVERALRPTRRSVNDAGCAVIDAVDSAHNELTRITGEIDETLTAASDQPHAAVGAEPRAGGVGGLVAELARWWLVLDRGADRAALAHARSRLADAARGYDLLVEELRAAPTLEAADTTVKHAVQQRVARSPATRGSAFRSSLDPRGR